MRLSFGRDKLETLETEIRNMTVKGAICTADKNHQGFYSQMLIVSKKFGGHRFIINLKNPNRIVRAQHFKMESKNMLAYEIRMTTRKKKVHLKDAYFVVPMREKHQDLQKCTCTEVQTEVQRLRSTAFSSGYRRHSGSLPRS